MWDFNPAEPQVGYKAYMVTGYYDIVLFPFFFFSSLSPFLSYVTVLYGIVYQGN